MPRIIDIDAPDTTIVQLHSPAREYTFSVDLSGFTVSEETDFARYLRHFYTGSQVFGLLHNLSNSSRLNRDEQLAVRQTRYQVTKGAGRFMPKLVRLAGEVNDRKVLLAVDLEATKDLETLQVAVTSAFYTTEMLMTQVFSALSREAQRSPIDSEVSPIYHENRRMLARSYGERMHRNFEVYCDSLLLPQALSKADMQTLLMNNREHVSTYFQRLLGGTIHVARLLHGF